MVPTINKTVVTEMRVTLADIKSRTVVCKAAGAASLKGNPLTSTSLVLSYPYLIGTITKTFTLICNKPVRLHYLDGSGNIMIQQTINNQFSFNGTIDCLIEIHPIESNTQLQLIFG